MGPVDVVAGAGPMSVDGVISDGRDRCYGGALSARAVCLRTRGGSVYEVKKIETNTSSSSNTSCSSFDLLRNKHSSCIVVRNTSSTASK